MSSTTRRDDDATTFFVSPRSRFQPWNHEQTIVCDRAAHLDICIFFLLGVSFSDDVACFFSFYLLVPLLLPLETLRLEVRLELRRAREDRLDAKR